MKILKYLTSLTIILFFNACAKNNKSPENSYTSSVKEETSDHSHISEIYISNQNIKKMEDILSVIDFKLEDKISLDSPKRFIQISIMFTLEQYANYYQAHQIEKQSDEEINEYLTTKRAEFYDKLGILEDDYIKYGIDNAEEIQEFLLNNPEFEHAYETTIDQITE